MSPPKFVKNGAPGANKQQQQLLRLRYLEQHLKQELQEWGFGEPSVCRPIGNPHYQPEIVDGSAPTHMSDDRKKQKQLLLMLQAHRCIRRDILNSNREVCVNNDCREMKAVLAHIGTCKVIRDCNIPNCTSTRRLLLHYKFCKKMDCIICQPFRRKYLTPQQQQQQQQ